jgi:hypothetical protein
MNGNPISHYISKKELESFLKERYSGKKYLIDDGFYNTKYLLSWLMAFIWKILIMKMKPEGFSIIVFLNATNATEEDVLRDAKAVQEILNKQGYHYHSVKVNGNVMDHTQYIKPGLEKIGFGKYSTSFSRDTELKLSDIKEDKQDLNLKSIPLVAYMFMAISIGSIIFIYIEKQKKG